MTALAQAMQAAGVQPSHERLAAIAVAVVRMQPTEWAEYRGCVNDNESDRLQRRLAQVAREAVRESPKNWDGAKDAFYAKVRKDPDMLWEMLKPYRAQIAQQLLSVASAEIREEERPKLVAVKESGGGQCGCEDRLSHAPATQAGGLNTGENLIPEASRPSAQAGAQAVAAVARLSLLDTFKVNGQPIGELTPQEANKWASARERDARFVRLLTANLPPDQPIKRYRTGDEAAGLMALAEKSDAE